MSFNIQSISSKLNDFKELITFFDDNNCSPNIICLQELWQFSPHLNTTLGGYHPLLFKLRNNTQGGGVGIYVKSDILVKQLPEFSVFADRILETIFVEITLPNNTKYTIGSIYRPGATHPTLTHHLNYLTNLMKFLIIFLILYVTFQTLFFLVT